MFTIDDFLSDYLKAVFSKEKYDRFNRIINLMFKLNNTLGNNIFINIDELQGSLIDVITATDDEVENTIMVVDKEIVKLSLSYIKRYGIVLNYDAKLRDIESLLTAIEAIYNIDSNMIEYVQMQIEDLEFDNNIEKLANILNDYSELNVTEYY